MSALPSWYDRSLTSDSADQPEVFCPHCDDLMQWEDDADEDGPCGAWTCNSKECKTNN